SSDLKFFQPFLQHLRVIIVAPNEMTLAIRAGRTFGEVGAGQAGREPAALTLEPAGDAFGDGRRRNIEPDRQVERRAMANQNALETLRLRDRARKSVEN